MYVQYILIRLYYVNVHDISVLLQAYFRRGEVHRALIEQPMALSSNMTPYDYRVKALTDYCQSYQLTSDPTTLSYCVILSVDLGKNVCCLSVCLSVCGVCLCMNN